MITPAPLEVLQAFCYASACRRRQDWQLVLQSAPVYRCTGSCGTLREFHEIGFPRKPETAAFLAWRPYAVMTKKEERSAKYWTRRRKAAALVPYCNCCHVECAIVQGSPVLRCACDPHGITCMHCSRGLCHCRCPKRPIVVVVQLSQSQEI